METTAIDHTGSLLIGGTTFTVDLSEPQLVEKGNPDNRIRFADIDYRGTHYSFNYDPETKNIAGQWAEKDFTVLVPQLKEIDPDGMAKLYGRTREEIGGLSDPEIMIDQEVVDERLSGKQPQIAIGEQIFFVDLNWGLLRPKDVFSTPGISLSNIAYDLNEKEDAYLVVYNPKTCEVAEMDWDNLTETPKEMLLIEIPFEEKLDPIGHARLHGLDVPDMIRRFPPQRELKAKIIPWEKAQWVTQLIKANRNRLKNPGHKARKSRGL